MSPTIRKLVLTGHVTVSVGWIGAVAAYLALVIAAMLSTSDQLLRSAWIAMELIGWYVIVPLAVTALATGIGIALGTPYGLFRHYWVMTSLILTAVATVVLVLHMPTVTAFAGMAADPTIADVRGALGPALRGELLHAGIGLIVLLGIETLNVFKPRGLTAYGRSKARIQPSLTADLPAGMASPRPGSARWVYAVWIHAAAVLLLFAILHVIDGGLSLHR